MQDTIFTYYKVSVPVSVATSVLMKELAHAESISLIRKTLNKIKKIQEPKKMDQDPQDFGTDRNAYVCMRVVRPQKEFIGSAENPYTYTVSFAFCSFTDTFNRKIARSIATSRCFSGKDYTFIKIVSPVKLSVRDVSARALALAHGAPKLVKAPMWFANTPSNLITIIQRGRHKAAA